MKYLIDYILEHISTTTIFEMAYDRRRYCDTVLFFCTEIIQNWCLVRYCSLYDEENYNKTHWAKELTSYLEKLQNMKLKSGNKLRATKQEFMNNAELNDEKIIFRTCKSKWLDENLPLDKLETISKEFSKEVNNICDHICDTKFDMRNYSYNQI